MAVDTEAQAAVLQQLEMAYERLAVNEQLTRTTDPELAEDFHRLSTRVLRARLAEEDNPEPKVPTMDCLPCAVAMRKGRA